LKDRRLERRHKEARGSKSKWNCFFRERTVY